MIGEKMSSYILKDIFGDTSRVRIIEELSERWSQFLSVSEIARMTDVSEKTVYTHIYQLEKLGIVISEPGRTTKYGLNTEDQRAFAISILSDEEYLRRINLSIEEIEKEDVKIAISESSYIKSINSSPNNFFSFSNNKSITV